MLVASPCAFDSVGFDPNAPELAPPPTTDQVTDSPTWTGVKPSRLGMRIEHRNYIRELRDLVWYRDGARGPVDEMIDDAAATIAAFAPADTARWPSPGAQVV